MDIIEVEVLDGGLLKIESKNKISAVNHGGMELLVRELVKAQGGKSTRTKIGHGHTHSHTETHDHE